MGDHFCVLADYRAYIEAQEQANQTYRDPLKWAKMAIQNVAGSGKFSSDRTISEYANDIWKLKPVPICQKKLMFIIARNFGILFLATVFHCCFSQSFCERSSFSPGEVLEYSMKWSFFPVGSATLEVLPAKNGGKRIMLYFVFCNACNSFC